MKKKLLSGILAAAMVMTMVPAVFAVDGNPDSTDTVVGAETSANTATTVSTYTELVTAIKNANDGDTITVSGTISVEAPLTVTKTVTLKGGVLEAAEDFTATSNLLSERSLISMKTAGKTLTLENITLDAKQKTLVVFSNAGKVVVDGATITGGKTGSCVAGVYMTSASQFEMNSGSITGNEVGAADYTKYAADLWIGANANGALTAINGGKVGNVFVNSNAWSAQNPGGFTMTGGTVENLYVEYDDGYGAAFTYEGGKIDHLYISKTTGNGDCAEVTPIAGIAYTGGQTGADVTDPVAKVGRAGYATLADAVAAAQNDDTVMLLKDATVTTSTVVTKKLTLDFGGHKLKADGKIAMAVAGNGDLTLQNGTIESINIESNSYVVDVDCTATDVAGNAKLTVANDMTINAPESYGIAMYGGNDTYKAIASIAGKVYAASPALSGNGSYSNTDITIEDGAELTSSDSVAIYHPQKGNLTVKGAKITGKGGIEAKSGDSTVTVENAEITATGTPSHEGNNSGTSSEGYAVAVIENSNYQGSPTFTITDGKFAGPIAILQDNDVDANKTGKITIRGGLFTIAPDAAYIAEGYYVNASEDSQYPYVVNNVEPSSAVIVVKDAAPATTVDSTISNADRETINGILNKTEVTGVAQAAAASKEEIAKAAGVTEDQLKDDTKRVEVEIQVQVSVTKADLTKGTLTYVAKPVATVKVDGTALDKTVDVSNSYLNGKEITVKLPLPENFTAKQIKHSSDNGSVEYFINSTEGSKRGAKSFAVNDSCAELNITKFSTFEISGEVTYVEPSSSHNGGGSSSSSYAITVANSQNGKVTSSHITAASGTTVTLTATPDKGYELDKLTVVNGSNNAVAVTEKDGKYTFTMPSSKVTVTGTFKQSASTEPTKPSNPFTDVPKGSYYEDAANWAVDKGVTGGTSATTFAPNGVCTRAQAVTFLWRAAGSPAPTASAAAFTDVPAGSYYAEAVQWAVEKNITKGTSATTFSPNMPCSRGQIVTFLWRSQSSPAASMTNPFTDVAANAFYTNAVLWAVEKNVTNGTSATTFSPASDCTRAQIVTLLYRALGK